VSARKRGTQRRPAEATGLETGGKRERVRGWMEDDGSWAATSASAESRRDSAAGRDVRGRCKGRERVPLGVSSSARGVRLLHARADRRLRCRGRPHHSRMILARQRRLPRSETGSTPAGVRPRGTRARDLAPARERRRASGAVRPALGVRRWRPAPVVFSHPPPHRSRLPAVSRPVASSWSSRSVPRLPRAHRGGPPGDDRLGRHPGREPPRWESPA